MGQNLEGKIVMTTVCMNAMSLLLAVTRRLRHLSARDRSSSLQAARSLLALFLGMLLIAGPLSPAFAQNPAQNPPSAPAPVPTPPATGSSIAPVASLGLATHDFTRGPSPFP